ncbi:actinorhodin polyketide synthase acyl carrier protein [Streptomyces libani subsp. rufus]|nr:actinorhodin polyketide synthase acyl carrier protein [Streptomyces libani subsp. rufus]
MLTLEQLRLVLAECAGEDLENLPLDDINDRTFEDLGYDSLVLLETSAQLKHRCGTDIPEDVIRDLKTPRAVLEYVNASAAAE